MPSNAFSAHLQVLLQDAEELDDAHRQLRTGQVGRQWRLGALNRAVIVICVELLRPGAPPLGAWPALNASARNAIGRFNNPNAENTRRLFAENLGLPDVTADWYWQNCDPARARDLLNEVLTNRHHVSHGVNTRPIINNQYSAWLPAFFRNLGRRTDIVLRTHLHGLGVQVPW